MGVEMDSEEKFDGFLQDATMAVNDEWDKIGGSTLTTEELMELNDVLQDFFSSRSFDK